MDTETIEPATVEEKPKLHPVEEGWVEVWQGIRADIVASAKQRFAGLKKEFKERGDDRNRETEKKKQELTEKTTPYLALIQRLKNLGAALENRPPQNEAEAFKLLTEFSISSLVPPKSDIEAYFHSRIKHHGGLSDYPNSGRFQVDYPTYSRVLLDLSAFIDAEIEKLNAEVDKRNRGIAKVFREDAKAFCLQRTALLRSCAKEELVPQFVKVCDDLSRSKRELPPLEVEIYRALEGCEKDLGFYSTEEVSAKLEALVKSGVISEQEALKVRYVLQQAEAQTPSVASVAVAPPPVVEVKENGYEIRPTILEQIIGDKDATTAVLAQNPYLLKCKWDEFNAYVAGLKKLPVAANSAANPLDAINTSLSSAGYDPEVVHAFINAFRPGTHNFIGANGISRESVRKNVRPNLDQTQLADFESSLRYLCKRGVINELEPGKVYSLNGTADKIPDTALRQAVLYHLGRAQTAV